jgi:hypothetical protein
MHHLSGSVTARSSTSVHQQEDIKQLLTSIARSSNPFDEEQVLLSEEEQQLIQKLLVNKTKYVCAIHKRQLMNKPVSTVDNETILFEEDNLTKWFSQNDTHPVTGDKLTSKQMKANTYVLQEIIKYRKKTMRKCVQLIQRLYNENRGLDACILLVNRVIKLTNSEDEYLELKIELLQVLISIYCKISYNDENYLDKDLTTRLRLLRLYKKHGMNSNIILLAEETLAMEQLFNPIVRGEEPTDQNTEESSQWIETLIRTYLKVGDVFKWVKWFMYYIHLSATPEFVEGQVKNLISVLDYCDIPDKAFIFHLVYEYRHLPVIESLIAKLIDVRDKAKTQNDYQVIEYCFRQQLLKIQADEKIDRKEVADLANNLVEFKMKFNAITEGDLTYIFQMLLKAIEYDPTNTRTFGNIGKLVPAENSLSAIFEYTWKNYLSLLEQRLKMSSVIESMKLKDQEQSQKLSESALKVLEVESKNSELKDSLQKSEQTSDKLRLKYFDQILIAYKDQKRKTVLSFLNGSDQLQSLETLTSDQFTLAGHEWTLSVSVGGKGFCEASLALESTMLDESHFYSLLVKPKIEVLNAKRTSTESKMRYFSAWKGPVRGFEVNGRGWGSEKLISVTDLKKVQSLDQKLYFRVSVTLLDGNWFDCVEDQKQHFSANNTMEGLVNVKLSTNL